VADNYTRIPLRTVRVPDDVWQHAKACAAAEGTTISAHIVQGLRTWRVAAPLPKPEPSPTHARP
jgi:hypothetical protein